MFFETEKLFSPDNGFVLNSLCFLCVFLVGLAAGSLFRIFLPFKKKSPSQRFISICVFLMLAAIIYTLLIFAEKSLFPISQFVSSHVECGFSENSYHLMLILIFLAGTVISLFWKIALPVCVILYAGLSFFTYKILLAKFGPIEQNIQLKLDETGFFLDECRIENAEKMNQFIVFEYCAIPDSVFLPVPRNWFAVKSISGYKNSSLADENLGTASEKTFPDMEIALSKKNDVKILENSLVSFYLDEILLKNKKLSSPIPVPSEKVYPSLFTLHVEFKGGQMHVSVIRTL